MSVRPQLQEILRKNGYRLTSQRQAILDVLQASTGLLTAEDIYQKTQEINSGINLATIYRTLTMLREIGVVEHAYASPEHHEAGFSLSRFSPLAKPDGCAEDSALPPTTGHSPIEKHFHFHCLRCGQLIQFQSAAITEVLNNTPALREALVDQVCMCIQGYCAECAEKTTQ